MGAWDLPNSKSPALYAPPDMNSKIETIVYLQIVYFLFFLGIVSGQYPLEEHPLY